MGTDLNKKLIIFDFETDGLNTDTCNAVQLAAIAIDLKKIQLVKNSEFEIKIRPNEIDHEDYFEAHENTINWHANLHNKEPHEIVDIWKDTHIPEKDAFNTFDEYVKRFNPGKQWMKLPILGGQNVREFDIPILKRKLAKFGITYRFSKRDIIDLKEFLLHWFLYAPNPPKNHKLDTMREYFSLSTENAHDAFKDVQDTAYLILKFLNLHSHCSKKIEAFK